MRKVKATEYLTAKDLAKLITLVNEGIINQNAARTVFVELWEHGGNPEDIINAKGLSQISDKTELEQAIAQVIAAEPEAAEKIQGGNLKPIQFLMGQVMKATGGKANPKLVQELIKKQLVQ